MCMSEVSAVLTVVSLGVKACIGAQTAAWVFIPSTSSGSCSSAAFLSSLSTVAALQVRCDE